VIKKVLPFAITLLFAVSLVCAESMKASDESKKLGITLDLTYMSKYMSLGAESYGQQGGLFETIDIDFWKSGFGMAIGHQNATSTGYVDKQRMNYNVYYKGKIFEANRFEMKYKLNWRYEHYYGRSRKIGNTQEWTLTFEWPELLQIANLAPYYIFDYEYPAGRNQDNRANGGAVHIFGLAYDLKTEQLPNPLKLSIDTSYTDGYGGPTKDHDWSHVTLGIGTKFNLTENLSLVPALYQQITMDKSVSPRKSITYAKISLKYKF